MLKRRAINPETFLSPVLLERQGRHGPELRNMPFRLASHVVAQPQNKKPGKALSLRSEPPQCPVALPSLSFGAHASLQDV